MQGTGDFPPFLAGKKFILQPQFYLKKLRFLLELTQRRVPVAWLFVPDPKPSGLCAHLFADDYRKLVEQVQRQGSGVKDVFFSPLHAIPLGFVKKMVIIPLGFVKNMFFLLYLHL